MPNLKGRWATVSMLLLFALAACSSPPRGRAPADDPGAPDPPAAQPGDDRYDFEEEGEFPEAPGDVAFEEDQLPPRPEDVEAAALSDEPVTAEEVEGEEDLPTPAEPTVTTPVQPTVQTPVPQGTAVTVERGFRVQLFAVGERVKANDLAREAGQRLGIAVHVVLEGSNYKVRAGDFLDRGDAVRLRERAMALGYDGCWVVTDEVELPR